MPELEVLSTDPGREVRTGFGSRMIAIRKIQQSPSSSAGRRVLGVFGTPLNDRGVPNVPVLLGDISDIFDAWGGFSPNVGDGAATGYNGNVAWLLWKLRAARVVFVPVDMALKDAGVDVLASIDRKFNVTGTASDEHIVTDRPHGLAVGDVVTFAGITGGASATWTGDKTVLAVISDTAITLTGVTFSTDITVGVMTASARPAYVVPAGTILTDGTNTVRTLSDLAFAKDTSTEQTVRVAKVSGTPVALNTYDAFEDTTIDARITTTEVAAADDTDATEIAVRYTAAMAAMNTSDAGKSANIVITDRTDADINDALTAHCNVSTAKGVLRIAVTAPPVGTSVADAEGSTGDGVARSTFDAEFGIYVHPGFQRRGDQLDKANLSAANDYRVTFVGQALLAAKMLTVREEENPTFVESDPFTAYGVVALEQELTVTEAHTHFEANICTATMERLNGRWVGAYRDGVMADGVEIATKRLTDLITLIAVERATPWHKRLASKSNRQGLFDSVDSALALLKQPSSKSEDQRIEDYVLTLTYDGTTKEATLIIDVTEIGSMNIITIRLSVKASGFSVLGAAA